MVFHSIAHQLFGAADMLLQQTFGAGQIAVQQSVDQLYMLHFALDTALQRLQLDREQCGERIDLKRELVNIFIIIEAHDHMMHTAVKFVVPFNIKGDGAENILGLCAHGSQLCAFVLCIPEGTDAAAFQNVTHVQYVVDVFFRKAADKNAAVGPAYQQSLADKTAERFAQRRAGDSIIPGKLSLIELCARGMHAPQDVLPQGGVDLLLNRGLKLHQSCHLSQSLSISAVKARTSLLGRPSNRLAIFVRRRTASIRAARS